MRSAISIVQVPELKARTGRPPQCSESLASKALTWGPEVSQPERRTSATPAIVSSSMVGRVKGRKAGAAGVGTAVEAGMDAGPGGSGPIAEKIKVRGLQEQMIMEGRIAQEGAGLRGGPPGQGEDPPFPGPFAQELGFFDEPAGGGRGRIVDQLDL